MPSKWAIIGASGFVGHYLLHNLQDEFALVGTHYSHPLSDKNPSVALDITNATEVDHFLDRGRVEGVVLTSAIADPNVVKADPVQAEKINVVGPVNVASACARQHIPLIHFSTDYVFNSPSKVHLLSEDNINDLHPVNEYGRLKLAAEHIVRERNPEAIILRIALVYGWRMGTSNRTNFVLAVLRAFRDRQKISAFTDQYGSPTYIGDIIRFMPLLMLAAEKHSNTGEIYHLAGQGAINRYEYALEIARVFEHEDQIDLIQPVQQNETVQQARRAYCSALDTQKIQRVFGFIPLTHAAGLARMRSETLGGDPHNL